MIVLQFILTFCLLSIVGSFAIYGVYICTRGEWRLMPDGKYKKTGMIFKYWSLFWEQYRKTEKVYYQGDALMEKFYLLKKIHPQIVDGRLQFDNSKIWGHSGNIIKKSDVAMFEQTLLCDITQHEDGSLSLSTQVPVYDWPEWVQKPLSSCPTCLAGPYGTIIWIFFIIVSRGTFSWSDRPILCNIGFGMLFLLTLACLNSVLHKLLKF